MRTPSRCAGHQTSDFLAHHASSRARDISLKHMPAVILLSLVLLQAIAAQSPFGSYEVLLSPRTLPDTCAAEDRDQFRNRTYTFGSRGGSSVTLHNGKAVELNPLGTPEWETSLVSVEPVKLGTREATLLVIGSLHVHGTGEFTHVLVVECRNRQLTVWFEAGGEGIRASSLDAAAQELSIERWIWSPSDAHCCPSKEGQERYRWRLGAGGFERIGTSERAAPK